MPTKRKTRTRKNKSGPKDAANSIVAEVAANSIVAEVAANSTIAAAAQGLLAFNPVSSTATTICSAEENVSSTEGESTNNDNGLLPNAGVHSKCVASDTQQPLEDADTELNHAASTKKRTPRGRTRNIKTGRRGKGDPKIKLEFDENGNVISDNSTEFANYCGAIVRDKAPQQVRGWHEIKNDIRMGILKEIAETYEIPFDAKIQELIWNDMGTKYRRFRTFLKREYYDKYKTNEERVQHRHPLLTKDDWAYLIKLFSSEEYQRASKRSQSNVANRKGSHAAGTRSFAKVKSMMKKEEGAEPGLLQVYERVRKRANGDLVDEHAKTTLDKVQMMATQQGITEEESFKKICPPKKLNVKQVFPIQIDGGDIQQPTTLHLMLKQAEERARNAEERSAQALAESKRAVHMALLHDNIRKDAEKELTQLRQEKIDLARDAAGARQSEAAARLQLSEALMETSNFYKSMSEFQNTPGTKTRLDGSTTVGSDGDMD